MRYHIKLQGFSTHPLYNNVRLLPLPNLLASADRSAACDNIHFEVAVSGAFNEVNRVYPLAVSSVRAKDIPLRSAARTEMSWTAFVSFLGQSSHMPRRERLSRPSETSRAHRALTQTVCIKWKGSKA